MSTATFTRLQEGSTGSAVTKLQQRLKTLNFYTGAADGTFGSKTKAAVIKFQQNNAVTADGIVGELTESAIQRAIWVSQRQTVQEGSQGKDVQKVQELLKKADAINTMQKAVWDVPGGTFGISSVDGKFGDNTKAAIIKFQQVSKLKGDGVVGAVTWNRLSGILTFDLEPGVIVANNIFGLA